MPCDITANQKRRHWLRIVEHQDQDAFSMGFENRGQVAESWFQYWEQAQPNPEFDFLNDGLLWEYSPGFPEGSTGAWSTYYAFGDALFTFNGTMWFYGFPTLHSEFGQQYSIEVRQQFWIADLAIQYDFYKTNRFRTAFSTTSNFTIHQLIKTSGPGWPAGDPFGQSQLYPLRRCHDCTSGP